MNWHIPAYQIQKNKKSALITPIIVGVLVLAICSVFGLKSLELKSQQNRYEQQIAYYQTSYDKEVTRSDEIAEYAMYTQTTAFCEEVARDRYRLVHDNEILFIEE